MGVLFLFILQVSNILKLRVGVLTFFEGWQKVNNQVLSCEGIFGEVGV